MGNRLLLELLKGLTEPERGGRPAFTLYHVHALLKELKKEPLGRPSISYRLGLSDSSVKTLLARLRERGLIMRSRGGAVLTEKGEELLKWLNSKVRVCETSLGFKSWEQAVAIAVSCVNPPVKDVEAMAFRDLFIAAGCSKAIVGSWARDRFLMPGSPPELESEIGGKVSKCFTEGDLMFVAIVNNRELDKAYNALVSVFELCL